MASEEDKIADGVRLRYAVDLPKPVYEILENEFWMLENFKPFMLPGGESPMKFSAPTSIYVRSGKGKAEINLQKFEFRAPCIVTVRAGEILNNMEVSEDFSASFMVFSEKFGKRFLDLIGGVSRIPQLLRLRLIQIPNDLVSEFDDFYNTMNRLQKLEGVPDRNAAFFYQTIAFYHTTVCRSISYEEFIEKSKGDDLQRLSDRFMQLVQKHFKQERFLGFYADKLNVTTKYLSKVVKQQTGVSAAEWISRQVVLEAKVLLKSSNLNVQQISVLLNFQSQSLFGKYFKTATGLSPKDFRNS